MSRVGAWLRGFSGLLAGGLVVLVVALGVAWAVAAGAGTPGPGVATLAWHAGAAIAAMIAQRQADRRTGAPGVLAAVAVIVITGVLLAGQWLA